VVVAFIVQSPLSDLGSLSWSLKGVFPVLVPLLLAVAPPLTEQLSVQLTVAFCPVAGLAWAVIETAYGNWNPVAKPHEAGLEDDWHCWLSWSRASA
jgi:hypothetical protein